MNAQSIPAIVIASISFYVGLYHLLIYVRRRQHRADLTFALLCLATGCYDVLCAGLYNAGSVAEGAQWQRLQFIALAFVTTFFLWFVLDYTGQKPGIMAYVFSAYYALAVIVQSVDRSHFTWLIDQPAIKTLTLPFGRQIIYYEATLGVFTVFQGFVGMAASTYILWLSVRFFRRGHRREAIPLLLALGCMYVAAISDTLVGQNVYQFIYVIEYGYLAMILLMAYSLSTTVVEAAMAKASLRASEERFRSLVETTNDWVWETDPNGVYTYASPRIRELLGYEPEEIIGKTPFDLMPSDESQRISAVFWDTLKAQKFFERLENTVRRKDGRLVVLETNGAPFFDANGEFAGHRGIDRDITKRKRAEEALKQSEERYRVISELIFDFAAAFRPGPDGKLIPEWNVGDITRITGYTPDELTALGGMVGIAHPDDLPILQQGMQALFNGQSHTNEYRIFTKHGQVRWLRDYGYAVQDEQGHSVHFYRAVQDITERKQAEQALRESEARWQFALEGSGDGVWDWNAQTNQVYFSRQWKAMLGFDEHEIGNTLDEWSTRIHPDDRDYVYEEIRKHLEGETPIYTSEHRVRGKDGTYKWILDRGQVIEWTKDGKPLRVIGTHSNITGRRQMEEALRESEEKFRSIVENALVGIFLIDDVYCFAYANDELGRILHYSSEELVGMDFRNVLSDESRAFVADYYIRRRRGEQLPSRYELSVVRQDGQVRYGEMSATIVRNAAGRLHTMGQFVDITERKRAEASLARRATELRKLYEASLDINAQLDMTTLLHKVVEHGAALIGALQGSLYLLQPDQMLELVVLHNLPVDFLGMRLNLGEGLAGRTAQEGQPMMVEDYQTWEGRSPAFDKLGARRVLSVPLKARNRVIGTLNVTDTELPGMFSEDEIRLLSLFADQAAVTIENTRLYEEAQHRAEYLATTNEISRAISTLQDPDSVLEVVYRQVQRTVPVDAFYIALYDAERDQVSFPIMYDLGVRYHEPDLFLGSNTWLAYVIHTGQPFILHRSAEEMQTPVPAGLGDKNRKSASILIVPLWQKERVVGVLSVQSYAMNAYNNRHAEILTGVGVQAIIAIENARLFTAAQQELEERKRIQAELETKNAELERFAYTVSHDLKSPLITIGGFVGFLEKDALSGNVEQVKTDVVHINDALARMQLLLDELLELSRIGRLMNPPEEISFEIIAREAVEAVYGRIEARGVEVEISPGLPAIYGDRARLVEVVQNLVDNACKFMAEQPHPKIEIGAEQDEVETVFYVRDNGIGIDPQYHEKVFGLFDKLDPQSEGTGIGLALVKRIVETHDGKIWVESQGHGQGSTFCFTLPAKTPDST